MRYASSHTLPALAFLPVLPYPALPSPYGLGQVRSSPEAVALLDMALALRSTKATQCNDMSSRSHCVVILRITPPPDTGSSGSSSTAGGGSGRGPKGGPAYGAIYLCDLAGSERLDRSQSHADPALLRETQSINKSLSVLGHTMHALASGQRHVPFRDSKLTYLLQDCFLGNGKNLLLCTLAPEDEALQGTLRQLIRGGY